VTYRPSPLAYALAVLAAWALCLAIALARAEMVLLAAPLLVPLLRAPAPRRARIADVQLDVPPTPCVEGEAVTLRVGASVEAAAGPVEIVPILPALLAPSTAANSLVLAPGADGRLVWVASCRCRASGVADCDALFFRAWDRSGLWVAESRHAARARIVIYPRASVVRVVPRPSRTGAPFGIHLSPRLGDGTDFANIRPFVAGDRLRRVNWPVSLRLGRLHANEFCTDRAATVVLLLDSFANIGRRPDSSLDHCLRAAASLALAYLRQHDRVGLLEYSGWVHATPPAAGPAQYARLLRSLAAVSISPTEFVQDLTALPERMLPWHALIVALSPLADARFVRMLGRLAEQGRDVVLLALRGDEVSADLAPRSARGHLIRGLWLLEREEQLRALRGRGARAANWSPTVPMERALVTVGRAGPMRGAGS
jgi:uncharacterized protein (DUF58 family)